MKVLTLTQPFATLVAIGAKCWETRGWQTSYRGPIAIHAAQGFPTWAQEECERDPFADVLRAAGYTAKSLPRGAIIATARLTGIGPTEKVVAARMVPVYSDEWCFSAFGLGRFAWHLEDVRMLPEPIPAKGSLGLWDFPLEVVEAVAL